MQQTTLGGGNWEAMDDVSIKHASKLLISEPELKIALPLRIQRGSRVSVF